LEFLIFEDNFFCFKRIFYSFVFSFTNFLKVSKADEVTEKISIVNPKLTSKLIFLKTS